METIIIDCNNLIHKVPHLKKLFQKDKESAQKSLIESVKVRLSRTAKAIFVFDGHGKIDSNEIIYSKNKSADEVIRGKIENFGDHRKLKVVSSDNEISNLAKVCGCTTESSENFWQSINSSNKITSGKNINMLYEPEKFEKPARSSKKDLAEFRKHFT